MKKRLVCLILAAAILCASSISYAGSYSAMTGDNGYSVKVDNNKMQITFHNDPEHHLSKLAGKTLLDLKKYDADNPLINFFPDKIQSQIEGLLPEGSDLNGLARYEFLWLDPADFEVIDEGKTVVFKFPIACKEDTNVVALFGIPDDTEPDGIRWITVRAEEVNGEVMIYISVEDLELLKNAEEIIMTIMALREKIEVTEEIINEITGNPSITSNDFGYSVSYNTEVMYVDFRIELPRILTSLAENVLNKLSDYIKTNSAISFFNDIVQESAAHLLPDDYDPNDLVIYEFVSLKAQVFDYGMDDVVASFTFPTEYEDGTILIAMIGVKDLTDVTSDTDVDAEIQGIKWLALKAEVVDGVVKIYFTKEALLLIDAAKNEIILTILSAPK